MVVVVWFLSERKTLSQLALKRDGRGEGWPASLCRQLRGGVHEAFACAEQMNEGGEAMRVASPMAAEAGKSSGKE